LGGWLILVGIGVVVSPLTVGYTIYDALSVYSVGRWHNLTSPKSEFYGPYHAPLLLFELIGNLTILALAIVVLILYLRKRRTFPHLFIVFLLLNACVLLVDFIGAYNVPLLVKENDAKELIQGVFRCAIWIPYTLVSKRVRATFIN